MNDLARFLIVTVLGVALDIGIAFVLATRLGVPLWLAATIGFVLAAAGNYVLHQLWSFQTGPRALSFSRAAKYGAVALTVLLTRVTVVEGLDSIVGPGAELAILIAGAGVSFCVNFTLSKRFVFPADTVGSDRA